MDWGNFRWPSGIMATGGLGCRDFLDETFFASSLGTLFYNLCQNAASLPDSSAASALGDVSTLFHLHPHPDRRIL